MVDPSFVMSFGRNESCLHCVVYGPNALKYALTCLVFSLSLSCFRFVERTTVDVYTVSTKVHAEFYQFRALLRKLRLESTIDE